MSTGGVRDSAERASLTYEALCRRLYDRRTHGFRRTPSRWGSSPEGLWPYANAWAATCALAEIDPRGRDDLPDRLAGVAGFHGEGEGAFEGEGPLAFEPRPVRLGGGKDIYYDDNAWVALALLHEARLTGEGRIVRLAERVFSFLASGWAEGEAWSHPGGVRWTVSGSSRNSCSTAPAIEIAVLLSEQRNDRAKLDWAIRAYRWMRETLLTNDGLYADRIESDGTVHEEKWSYNQGTMIGGGVLLAEATGDPSYLEEAQETAAASLRWLAQPGVLERQGPPLFSIYARNLLLLPGLSPQGPEREIVRQYGERWWEGPDHRGDGLFQRGDDLVNPTAGMVTVYSLLAGGPPHA